MRICSQHQEYDPNCDLCQHTTERASGSLERVAGGIIIPERPPASIVEVLNNFVAAVYAYEETGVWPDNGTIRRLAEEGREALGHRYFPNSLSIESAKSS